ncbi:hypothetical protein E2C01_060182 [Portunus trituberculatus]|uniref:Uncharacterized protein n=1 Tax=Portunus trituberculatus TaxID=210409 RepID=A0A5B7H866_PORTR|nr:hypothetical protein [Portunus trituberculatus]
MQATLHCSTSCLHAASTMPRKATSSPSLKRHNFLPFKDKPPAPALRHNFLPFKDKLELIRKCEAGIAQCRCNANGCPKVNSINNLEEQGQVQQDHCINNFFTSYNDVCGLGWRLVPIPSNS